MAKFAKGKHALAISDRSGLAFPWRQMVTEWNGAFVHYSEYEPKQPQLEPKPFVADPQGLEQARPARTEFGTQDFLPKNPFTTAAASTQVTVSEPFSKRSNDDIVRFAAVKSPVGGVAISTFELSTTLSADITSTDESIAVTDSSAFPSVGYFIIEKVQTSSTGDSYYENEVIQYTGNAANTFTGCTRGSSAPYKGLTPPSTTAGSHSSGAKVFGSYLATAVGTSYTPVSPPGTETQYNSLTVPLVSNATSTDTGGGFQCTIGPVNDRD